MESPRYLSLWGTVQTSASLHSQISTEGSISAGTIWFKARGCSQTRDMTLIVEDVSGSGRNIVRTPIKTIVIPARTSATELTWTQYQIVLQANTVGRLVFRNATTSGSSSSINAEQIHITDIVITPPQSDVRIERIGNEIEPGFPSVQDPVTFRCTVSDVFDIAPAQHITPKLVWRQNGGEWNVTPMTNVLGRTVQEPGDYAISITDHGPGSFEYFFRADFTGYTPSFEAVNPAIISSDVRSIRFSNRADEISFNVGQSGSENTISVVDSYGDEHDFDETAKAMLSRSPAYSYDLREWLERGCEAANIGDYIYREDGTLAANEVSDWELSHRFDFENLADGWLVSLPDCSTGVTFEDTYEYSKPAAPEGIRRFRSRYGTLTLGVSDYFARIYAAAGLEPSYSMQQVGDYTWQALVRLTNEVDIAATVRSEWEYDEKYGVFSYSTYQWGEIDQEETAINPPMAGELTRLGPREAKPSGWDAVRTQINYSGFLMFRFCTTNGAYQVRRAAWQDFNAWQADDDWFSRSFGLYGTQTFDNDVESVSPTIDGEATIIGLNSRTPVSDSLVTTRTTRGGMSAQNFRFVKERVRAVPSNYTSTAANFAWRLSTAAIHPGSLETTGESRGDGRGTLKMRVRAGTGDDRAILYNGTENAANWQSKRFVGKFSEAKLSEGLPSFSVYGYWQDPDNYWEARVTQTNLLLSTGTTAANSQRAGLVLELFKKENGVKTRIAVSANTTPVTGYTVPGWYDASNARLDRSGDTILVLDLRTAASGSVIPRATLLYNANFTNNNRTSEPTCPNNGAKSTTTATHACYLRPTSPVWTTVDHGTVGYNTRDCEATVVPYVFEWQNGAEPSNSSSTDEIVKANGSANFENRAVSTSGASSWVSARDDGMAVYQGESPWHVTVPAGGTALPASPATIKRDVHDANYRILVYRTYEEECREWGAPVGYGDTAEWDGRWDSIHGHAGDGIKTVSSFDWTEVEIPMSLWDDTFIRIEAVSTNAAGVASTADLMVDDISCTAWTGQTVWYPDYYDDYVNKENSWKGLYAAVEQTVAGATTNRYYVLDRTRANPNVAREFPQSVTTPYLEHGVGDIYFSYKAEGGDVAFVVERLLDDGTAEEYFSTTATVETASAWIPKYVPIFATAPGRIRIRTKELYTDEYYGTEIFGRLLLDDLRATDYPKNENEGSAWEAYNALVSTFRSPSGIHANLTEREFLAARFDGPADPARFRSAVLNDSAGSDTMGGIELGEHKPYIQTPRITTGIGEVSFWYRRSPDATGPTTLKLYASESASPVDDDWVELTVDRLNADSETYLEQVAALEALSSIETDTWTYFTAEFFESNYKILRIYGDTNGFDRVMLDNVLVTEPVRASIDVGSITFNPTCPLATSDVSVKVRLVNPRMNPKNIKVRLEYYVGTNVWGYGDPNLKSSKGWWNSTSKGAVSLTNTVTKGRVNRYEFASVEKIPHFNVDDVVQYCAVVEYDGTFAAPVYSDTQIHQDNTFWFRNPEWYEPRNLNEELTRADGRPAYGDTDDVRPVAHYWVFSCPPESVWINEIRNVTPADAGTAYLGAVAQSNQFVEIIGPEGASLAGWKLEHYGMQGDVPDINSDFKWTNTMDTAAAFMPPNNASAGNPKGWGFWVLGGANLYPDQANQLLFPGEEAAKSYTDYNHGIMNGNGAMRLRRSMGAYVDRVVWARNDDDAAPFLDLGFRRVKYSRDANTVAYAIIDYYEGMIWERGNTSMSTVGGYNPDEESYIFYIDKIVREDPDDPVDPEDPVEADAIWYVDGANGRDDNSGRTWDTAFKTIQRAVDCSIDGNRIFVASGIYEPFAAMNRDIVIQSAEGAETTIIDGGGEFRCATLGESTNDVSMATLAGFTLQNGLASSGGGVKGGIAEDCIIQECTSYGNGGGAANAELRRCIIRENSSAGAGGGASGCMLSDCLVVLNNAEDEDNCGGGIHSSTAVRCTISDNSVVNYGSGSTVALRGGAGASYSELSGCIVCMNSLEDRIAGDGVDVDLFESRATYSCLGSKAPGEGNIASDPLFVSGGDYRLSANSPCIGAGAPDADGSACDLGGMPRVSGHVVDMGCYEFQGPVSSPYVSVVAGTGGGWPMSVSISCTNEAATIHYTTDGSDPTEESPVYRRFRVYGRTTVKAIAVVDGILSDVAEAECSLGVAATPVIEAPALFVGSRTEVSISCATVGATIRYTLDGSEPGVGSEIYVEPFFVTNSCIVKAYATNEDYLDSEVASFSIKKIWRIGDTMGDPDRAFSTAGDAAFFRVDDATAPLGEAMRSGAITHGQTSTMSTWITGSGTVAFQWRTSCEDSGGVYDWDHAEFEVDGTVVARLDGVTEWQSVTNRIDGAGQHTLLWRYVKDEVESEGEDCCWVADFSWTPAPVATFTSTTPEPVPHAWLSEHGLGDGSVDGYEAAALATAANGRPVWECYVADLDPAKAEDDLTVTIAMKPDGTPEGSILSGESAERVYETQGAPEPGGPWGEVTEESRFFRVKVSLPEP